VAYASRITRDVVRFRRERGTRRIFFETILAERMQAKDVFSPALMRASISSQRWREPFLDRLVFGRFVLSAEPSVGQVRTSRIGARLLRFPWHLCLRKKLQLYPSAGVSLRKSRAAPPMRYFFHRIDRHPLLPLWSSIPQHVTSAIRAGAGADENETLVHQGLVSPRKSFSWHSFHSSPSGPGCAFEPAIIVFHAGSRMRELRRSSLRSRNVSRDSQSRRFLSTSPRH
jgi:hypothetical protein